MSSKQLPQPSKIPPRTSPPTPRPHTFFSKIAPPSPRKFTRGTPRPQAEPLSVKPTAGGANAAFASNKHRDLLSDVIFENTLKKTSVTPQGVYHVGEGGNEVFIPKLRGLVDDEYVEVDRSKLADILAWAEREKAVISDELQKLEEARSHNEQLLQQEIARNQTLHEDSMKEQHKWEKVLSTKGDELTEVTSRCNELIRDREEAAQKLEHAASTKKHFIAALAILLALLLYFLLGSGTSPAAVPS
uniref:Uncharacterized protein n=1 Tax=Ciona savignyi TaxID=51511 RepID=H2YEG4_CIOSA